jgi:histidyl-tRNA synthetase
MAISWAFSANVPSCVGISFGADRLYTILKAQREREATLPTLAFDVYVMALGSGKDFDGLLPERLQICSQLCVGRWHTGWLFC